MLNRILIVVTLGIGALATYAEDSVAATTTTSSAACVTRPPKTWKSTGGTFGICVSPTVGSIRIDYLADEDPGILTAVITPLPPGTYITLRNKPGHFPPGVNPYLINWVYPTTLTCQTGPAYHNPDTGLFEATCTVTLPLTAVPIGTYPRGLIPTKAIPQAFDVDISTNDPDFKFWGTGSPSSSTSLNFELRGTPQVGANGMVGTLPFSSDVSEIDPVPACGNSVKESDEQCDDGNAVNGDGCSSVCQIEPPPTVCGNGAIESGEQCDDHNTNNGDGCSSVCQIEPCVSILLHCDSTSPVLQTFCGTGSHSVANGEILDTTRDRASYAVLTSAVASATITASASCSQGSPVVTTTIPTGDPNFCNYPGGPASSFNDKLCDINITSR